MAVRVADIAERIVERRKIYTAAYECDLRRLSAEHGDGPVQDALAMIETHDGWDREAHARAVQRGIERVLRERRQRASEFPDAELLPGSWR
jgi:hypothetical protein